jgi:hypothetical protein
MMSLQEATSLAERTASLIDQGQYFEAARVVNGYDRVEELGTSGYRFGEVRVIKVAEQLMTGFSMAYPHRVNPGKVLAALSVMTMAVTLGPDLTLPGFEWGSSLRASESKKPA